MFGKAPLSRILVVVILFLAVSSFLIPASGSWGAPTVVAPPHGSPPSSFVTHRSAPAAVSALAPAASRAAAPRGVGPAVTCDTPSGLPIWNSPDFFSDALVTFYTPGQPSLSGNSFQIMPCANTLPTYTNGFWMNVSTNVAITQALVRVWGVAWPGGTTGPPITGFDPTNVSVVPMAIKGPLDHSATFWFNDYRFFWPGSTVYFNITLVSVNATPSTIYSARGIYSHPVTYSGITNNATWTYGVQAPFASTNFSQDIAISTVPSITSTPSYEPSRFQSFQVELDSINASGGPGIPIPAAQLNVTLVQSNQVVTFPLNFGPANHSKMLSVPMGPYPGDSVQFYVTAWLPWGLTQVKIDRITSAVYKFNWTANGGWWYPQGEFTDNLVYTTTPGVLGPSGVVTKLQTGTAVNVSVQVKTVQNVTIVGGNASSQVHFLFRDSTGTVAGSIPMAPVGTNGSYAVLPGLPSGSSLTFYTVVKDSFGNPISSGNTTYSEAGQAGPPLPPGYAIFFFEVVDLATGALVPSVNFTLSNNSWSETGTSSSLGFGYPFPSSAPGILPVAWGTYVLTVRAFGVTQTATFPLTTPNNCTGSATDCYPMTIIFYVSSSGAVAPFATVPVLTISYLAVGGVLAASVATYPILNWFKERRKKSEEEQRRITL